MKLYGQEWIRRELEARVGRIEQIGGVRRYVLKEGPEEGLEAIQVRTGAGLSYWVMPGKGLDISLTEMNGIPISWSSGNGEPHSAYYDDSGLNWLRTASGGLLMTCGLTQVGSPGEDIHGAYGLHGRVHHTPARQVSAKGEWSGDEYEMQVSGLIEETSIFGQCLKLNRTITSRLGENKISIHDVVENVGFQSSPHMMLYHFNFGFPLMSEHTVVELPSSKAHPRDPDMDLTNIKGWQAPDPDFREQVFYHEPDEEQVKAKICNPSFPGLQKGLTVELAWQRDALPRLVQWRMPGAGVHVLGLEPSNCWTRGRKAEQDLGSLQVLEAGQSVEYELELSFYENE